MESVDSLPAEIPAAPGNTPPHFHRLHVFYHYLYPDNVVSAVHMDQLSQGLASRGWQVRAFPANRGCRDEEVTYGSYETHQGVELERIWRPGFRQASSAGRVLNAAWMIARWSLLALRPDPPSAILIGTDPILSATVACIWKLVRPRTRIVHWCFDLYPEAAVADGMLSAKGLPARLLTAVLRRAYAACDALVDIGPCMRERLAAYRSRAVALTIVPWALEETPTVLAAAAGERDQIFQGAALGMLYSGNFGRAHSCQDFLSLAARLRGRDAVVAFSVRGNNEPALRKAVKALLPGSSCPVVFVPFAPAGRLRDRLAAPDVHLLSLAPEWTGTVVPSKFFGALAAGRPVLYAGSPQSSVAQWIQEHGVGWVLSADTMDATAADLLAYSADPERARRMQEHCLAIYQAYFSRKASVDRFDALLLRLVQAP